MQAREYVEEVMRYVEADASVKRRLTDDLYEHIEAAGGEAAIARMGDPREMAAELMDTIYGDKSEVIRELVRTKARLRNNGCYEYISKRRIFGMPLVHVYYNYGYGRPFKVAKGFIAAGNVAVGVVAFGGISFGLVSFGGIALGALCLGGVSLGALAAFGGVAIGTLAVGGAAIGMYAFGGAAVASHIAVGGAAFGKVAIGGAAEGAHTIVTGGTSLDVAAITKAEARALINQALPGTWPFITRLLTCMFR